MRTLWETFIDSRAFWLAFLSASVEFTGCPSLMADERRLDEYPGAGATVTLSAPSGYMLTLQIHPGEHDLTLFGPDMPRPIEIGRMDCHQMSDTFRWEEFEALRRHFAREQPDTAWAPELLLSPYVAVTAACAEAHLETMRACLSASRVFSEAEISHVLAYARSIVRQDFRWIKTRERGWVAEGHDAYSLRQSRCDFNFRAFNAFVVALEKPDLI